MDLFDTHCHLDLPAFEGDRAAVLDRARRAGVREFLVPGVERKGWERLLALCRDERGLYPALGLHPVFTGRHDSRDLKALERYLAAGEVVAVGEIGLDYQVADADRPAQRALLDAQLAIAREAALPVVLHVRKAHEDALAALKRSPVPGGFAHAFNGSLEQARRYRDMGFALGFGGMLTYERSTRLRRLARELPLDALVLETDAPDLTVASHRGERNSPEYLAEICLALAGIRGEAPETVAAATRARARAVLGLT